MRETLHFCKIVSTASRLSWVLVQNRSDLTMLTTLHDMLIEYYCGRPFLNKSRFSIILSCKVTSPLSCFWHQTIRIVWRITIGNGHLSNEPINNDHIRSPGNWQKAESGSHKSVRRAHESLKSNPRRLVSTISGCSTPTSPGQTIELWRSKVFFILMCCFLDPWTGWVMTQSGGVCSLITRLGVGWVSGEEKIPPGGRYLKAPTCPK